MRHANATELHIDIQSVDDRIITKISDNGRVKGKIKPGNGLNGMQERLAVISGSLSHSIVDGHLELVIDVPSEVQHDN